APILALLIWGAVSLLGPKRDADQQAEAKGAVPAGPAPRPAAPRPKAPRAPVPKVDGDAYFQTVWADLHSDEHFTRKAAAENLAKLEPNAGRAVVARKLVELTKDESPFIRWPAVRALGKWGSENEVPALLEALAHQDAGTRKEALKVIGRFRD